MSKKADASADMLQRLEGFMTPEKYKLLRARLFPSLHDLEAQKLVNNQKNAIWRRELAELIVLEAIQKNIKAYENEIFELKEKERIYYENRILFINLLTKLDEEQAFKLKMLHEQYLLLVATINQNLSNCLNFILERISYMDKLIERVDSLITKVEEMIKESKSEFINICTQIIDNLQNIPQNQKNLLSSLISDFKNNIIALDEFYEEFVKQVKRTGLAVNNTIDSLLSKLDFRKEDIEEKTKIYTDLKNVKKNIIEHKKELLDYKNTILDNKSAFNNNINNIPLPNDKMSYSQIRSLFQENKDSNLNIINDDTYSNKSNINSKSIYDKIVSIETRLLNNIYNQPSSEADLKAGISLNNPK